MADQEGSRSVGRLTARAALLTAALVLLISGIALSATSGRASRLTNRDAVYVSPGGGIVVTESPIPTATPSLPLEITAGPDGNVWFTAEQSASIFRITQSLAITQFPVVQVSGPRMWGIAGGPDGNVWFGENFISAGSGALGRITPSGTISQFFVFDNPTASPHGIVAGPDGNIWFTEPFEAFDSTRGGYVGAIYVATPQGALIHTYRVPTIGSAPWTITRGPDGNLWFTEEGGNKIGRITPSGTITEFPVPTGSSAPWGIVTGPDGNLWFTEEGGNKIGRITPSGTIAEFRVPTARSQPRGIAAGPDGNIWFTEFSGDKIGRITPSGTITEIPLGTNANPYDITAGPDRNLWFTEYGRNAIGRVLGLSGPRFTLSPSFGTVFSDKVAELHPAGGPSNESATIAWGDGSVTNGTLGTNPTDPTELDVFGTHTYWVAGRVPVTITLTNRVPVTITLTNSKTGATQAFNGHAVVSSTYAGLGDSYSAGEGAGWPPGQSHPNLPGCDWQLYQDPSGSPMFTDQINGAKVGPVPLLGGSNGCKTVGVSRPLTGNTCHRATTAYAHVVERLLAVEGMTLDFVACSGDIVHDAYVPKSSNADSDKPRHGEDAQASTKVLGPTTSLITLTLGGNDLHFADIAGNCVTDDLPRPAGSGPNNDFDCIKQDDGILSTMGYHVRAGGRRDGVFRPSGGAYHRVQKQGISGPLSANQLARLATGPNGSDSLVGSDLHDALVLLYRTLKAQAPGARILVLGYPHFFQNGGTSSNCEHFSNLEQRWVNDRISVTDTMIEDAVAESGVAQYVDVSNALTDGSGTAHQECAGASIGDSDVNFSVDPSTYQVAPCTGNWINPIDVLAVAVGKLPGNIAVSSPEILHPNPCGHQAEGEMAAAAYRAQSTPIDTFALGTGQGHTTTIGVAPGLDRINLTTNWVTGNLRLQLTDPSGTTTYKPTQEGPTTNVPGNGLVPTLYATWDVPHPVAGTWTFTVTNVTTGDSGVVQGSISEPVGTIVRLPPAGQVHVVNDSCLVTCTATFHASVSPAARSLVANYSWFDDQGKPQPTSGSNSDTTSMSSFSDCFRVILRTNGTNGQHRYTVFKSGTGC